ncbi:hypothetical protein LEL_05714 [Akanthomyces lecanii RCEF 1005]|uniref:Uncharacterized protein n=1 Tax=Akanthomyces lecanii RCEF 1005 TaxID=1081108 RepID=A0A168G4Z0_CORDF|nr:hypothetical protein LEL_05714 [Akanthomyces lecanii RCEF 1005]
MEWRGLAVSRDVGGRIRGGGEDVGRANGLRFKEVKRWKQQDGTFSSRQVAPVDQFFQAAAALQELQAHQFRAASSAGAGAAKYSVQ